MAGVAHYLIIYGVRPGIQSGGDGSSVVRTVCRVLQLAARGTAGVHQFLCLASICQILLGRRGGQGGRVLQFHVHRDVGGHDAQRTGRRGRDVGKGQRAVGGKGVVGGQREREEHALTCVDTAADIYYLARRGVVEGVAVHDGTLGDGGGDASGQRQRAHESRQIDFAVQGYIYRGALARIQAHLRAAEGQSHVLLALHGDRQDDILSRVTRGTGVGGGQVGQFQRGSTREVVGSLQTDGEHGALVARDGAEGDDTSQRRVVVPVGQTAALGDALDAETRRGHDVGLQTGGGHAVGHLHLHLLHLAGRHGQRGRTEGEGKVAGLLRGVVAAARACLAGHGAVLAGQVVGLRGARSGLEVRECDGTHIGQIGRCGHLDIGNGTCAGVERRAESQHGCLARGVVILRQCAVGARGVGRHPQVAARGALVQYCQSGWHRDVACPVFQVSALAVEVDGYRLRLTRLDAEVADIHIGGSGSQRRDGEDEKREYSFYHILNSFYLVAFGSKL